MIRKYVFLQRVITLAGGASIGQVAVLLVSPIVSRIYDPAEFGVFGIYVSIVGFVAVFASLRLELAIPMQQNASDADILTRSCIAIVAVLASFVFILLTLISTPFSAQLNIPNNLLFYLGVAVGIFGVGSYNVISFQAISTNRFNSISKSKAIYGLVMAACQVFAFKIGYFGLILSDLSGRFASSAYLIGSNVSSRITLRRGEIGRARSLISKHRNFPLLSAPAAIVNSAGVYGPAMIVASIFGIKSAGAFIFTTRVISAPAGLIGQAVSKVYIGDLTSRIKKKSVMTSSVFSRTVGGLAAFSAIPFAILFLSARPIFEFVFGEQWTVAGEIASVLSPMLFFQFISVPVSQTLNLLGQQSKQLAWDIFRLFGVILVFVSSIHLGITFLNTMALLSIFSVLAYCVLLYISWSAIRAIDH